MRFQLLLCLASFEVANAFGSVPRGVINIPDKFTLRVPDRQIKHFKTLLEASTVGPETWYTNHGNGQFDTTRQWLADAKDAWLKLDWRKQEKRINSFPNFKTNVDDVEVGPTKIHFAALFSTRKDALPLLFLHGWPGSFLEFLPLLDILKKKYTPETLPYHVIVPSLPHYGLTGGPSDVELTMEGAARLLNQLMLDLGFGNGYVAQGGDIGSFLTRILSAASPAVKAFHINMLAPGSQDEILSLDTVTQVELEHVQRMYAFSSNGSSYLLEHDLRPSTIGLVLSSNPLAMFAWIGEKLIEWADHRHPLSLDTILTLISFYWYTDIFPRSMYPYRALASSGATGENILVPESWAEQIFPNLTYYKRNDREDILPHWSSPNYSYRTLKSF